ncbi:DUF4365 domain-containing protein [Deinococcus sp. A31D244]|uniref:DUF4365 domain-containing protein n=1 Tax=Deinococcus sp. A31D244 TaxID=3397675 RepID=UPI0039DFF626
MHLSQRKEQFSVAYVHAVCSLAGYATGGMTVDDDGIDIIIGSKGKYGTMRSPRVEAQLKCTADPIVKQGKVEYRLKRENYDLLREETYLPRILIVLQVPKEADDWIVHSESGILLRHHAYWVSLLGNPASANKGKVKVELPIANLINPSNLHRIMNLAGMGEKVC